MTAPPVQGPLWHPLPQWAVVLPQNYDMSAAIDLPVPIIKVLTPYREQQLPWGQFPHIVLSLLAPQVPSVVVTPVGGATVGFPRTGSWEEEAPVGWVVGVASPSQPLWHPSTTKQLPKPSAMYVVSLFMQYSLPTRFTTIPIRARLAIVQEPPLPSCGPTHKMNSSHRKFLLHHMLHHHSFSRSGHPIGALSGLTGLLLSCNQICTPGHSERQCLHTIRIPKYFFSVWGEKRAKWMICLQSSMIPKWEVSNPTRLYQYFRTNYLVVRAVGVTYSTANFRSTCPICWECTRDKSRYSKRMVVQRLRMGLASIAEGTQHWFPSVQRFQFRLTFPYRYRLARAYTLGEGSPWDRISSDDL